MTVYRDLFITNCTFWDIAHNAYTFIYMEKESSVNINGLKFERITGSTIKPLNSFILTNMKEDSSFKANNIEVLNS